MLVGYNGDVDMNKALDRLRADLKPYQTGGISIKPAGVQNGPSNNVDVQVTGANQGDVTTATKEVLHSLGKVKGLTDLQSNLQARQPQLQIAVDPRKAFLHGLTPATAVIGGLITSTLLTLVVVPVIYSLFTGLRRGITGGSAATEQAPVAGPAHGYHMAPERVALSTES